jgi:hypothetical protein
MWKFEIRVETPDRQVLTNRYAGSPTAALGESVGEEHFDWFMRRLADGVKRELKSKGYME